MTEYITEQGAQNLRNFKYKGGSLAISYQHLWSPLAEYIVEHFPKTVAPNTITLIGTIIHIIGNLSLIIQGRGNPQLWPYSLLFFGSCVFVYYTLDNVDGKQARRTHNSSPLGMCMDHGCDVLGVSFIALGVGQLVGMADELTVLFTSQIAVLGTFWMSVWSQYHSKGILVLGKINAVDDGIPFVAFLGFFTYFVGQQFWIEPVYKGFNFQIGLAVFIWVAGIAQIFGLVLQSGDNFTKDLKGALSHLIHYAFLILALASVVFLTNWPQQFFYPVYFATALIVVRDTSYMHVCVAAQDTYNQWQLSTVGYIISYISFSIFTYVFQPNYYVQAALVYSVLIFSVYNYFSYCIKVSRQMAKILGIRIFHIDADKLKRNQ